MMIWFIALLTQNVIFVNKMLFWRPFNVFWMLWTSDGRQNNVVCLLGGFSDVFLYIRIRVKLQLPLWYDFHNLVQAVSGNFFLFCFFLVFQMSHHTYSNLHSRSALGQVKNQLHYQQIHPAILFHVGKKVMTER